MKIKVLTRDKGNIVAAVLPDPRGRNLAEAGPAVMAVMSFDEVELPAGTRSADISPLLQRARIKRVKKTVSLKVSKKLTKRARPVPKRRGADKA